MKTGQFYRSWYCKSVEIGVRREANHSQVGHLARICDNVWRRFSTLLFSELANQDTRWARKGPTPSSTPLFRASLKSEAIHAAVDRNHGAGDVARERGRKKNREV